ncbi:MAG: hypothetical protein K2K06_12075 [Oscillospiraceae bacterium]|nr:hypothetical protein [Oscillospiraceae bacterium]
MMKTPDMSHYEKCRKMMKKQEQYHKLRMGLVIFTMLENAFWRIIILHVEETIYSLGEFFMEIGILLYCAILLIIGVFVLPKRPKLLAIACILLFIGIMFGWIAWYIGMIMLGLLILQIPETKLAVWLKQQEGYPHFNERLTEQTQNVKKGYQSEYKFDSLHDAEMPSIPEFSQDISEQLSSDLTATEKISASEIMEDIPEITSFDLTVTKQTQMKHSKNNKNP